MGPWRLHLKQLLFSIVATLFKAECVNTPNVSFFMYAAVATCDLWTYSDPIRGSLRKCANSINSFVCLESDPTTGNIFFLNSRSSRMSLMQKTPFKVMNGFFGYSLRGGNVLTIQENK